MPTTELRQKLIADITEMLPSPVITEEKNSDRKVTLIAGDPGEVVVTIGSGNISTAEFKVTWKGPCTPICTPRNLGKLKWKNIPEARLRALLRELVCAAIDVRRSKYRSCSYCQKANPPEWMHDDSVCQSCAERHLGVVH